MIAAEAMNVYMCVACVCVFVFLMFFFVLRVWKFCGGFVVFGGNNTAPMGELNH